MRRRYGSDAVSYAFGLAHGHSSCEKDAITQLVETLKEVGPLSAPIVWSCPPHSFCRPSPFMQSVWHLAAAHEHARGV